jgi:hypothetical protein
MVLANFFLTFLDEPPRSGPIFCQPIALCPHWVIETGAVDRRTLLFYMLELYHRLLPRGILFVLVLPGAILLQELRTCRLGPGYHRGSPSFNRNGNTKPCASLYHKLLISEENLREAVVFHGLRQVRNLLRYIHTECRSIQQPPSWSRDSEPT